LFVYYLALARLTRFHQLLSSITIMNKLFTFIIADLVEVEDRNVQTTCAQGEENLFEEIESVNEDAVLAKETAKPVKCGDGQVLSLATLVNFE